jgi:2-polyprenyl-3-methyl-5-hydroxy-6-metoxy-1,4-benzoquinol methylase
VVAPHEYYPLKHSRHSSHDLALRYLGSGKRLLEIGCGACHFSRLLIEAGNEVTGVDFIDEPAIRPPAMEYIRADLHFARLDAHPSLAGRRFDAVLLMDVLEHLLTPERILRECLSLLAPGGEVLVSLPNVANIYVRLSLLAGRFEYAERGILDRTHLHFYTRRSARRMIEQCGFQIQRQFSTVIPVELALGLPPHNLLMRTANWLLRIVTSLWPALFAYQYIFVARPRGPSG